MKDWSLSKSCLSETNVKTDSQFFKFNKIKGYKGLLIKQSLKAILCSNNIKFMSNVKKSNDMNCRLYHKSKLDLLFKVYIFSYK